MRINPLVLCLLAVLTFLDPVFGEKLSIGVVPFKEVGSVAPGTGKELAAFVSGILGDRYVLKERLDLSSVLRERMFQAGVVSDPDELKEEMKKYEVDLLFLGQISKTEGEFTLFVRLSDLSGTIGSFRSTIQASNWEALKEKLRLCLIQHKLAPLTLYEESPVKVIFRFTGDNLPDKKPRVNLEGERRNYTLNESGEVVPGRYKVKVQDSVYEPYETWIDIKPGKEPDTVEIRLKAKGINISLVVGYGGVGAILLGIVYTMLRLKIKKRLSKEPLPQSSSGERAVQLAKSLENECASLMEQKSFEPFLMPLNRLRQEAGNLVTKIEMMPEKDRAGRAFYLEQAIAGLSNEIRVLMGFVQAGASGDAEKKIEELIHRVCKVETM